MTDETEQIVSVSYFSRPLLLVKSDSPLLSLAKGVLEVEEATAKIRKLPATKLCAFRDANLEHLRECVEALGALTEELGGYIDL